MIQARMLPLIALLAALLASPFSSAAKEVEDYSKTINEFKNYAESAPFFESAYAYAVFPTIGKGGFGIGGSHGKGQVYQGGKVVGFTSTSDISFGAQAGGQAYSQIIFFKDKGALDAFTSGNFEFGAEASAIAIKAEAKAEASTEVTSAGVAAGGSGGKGKQANIVYQKGMQIFTFAKGGLMYQAAISGQKYKYDPVK